MNTTHNIEEAKAYPFPFGMRALASDAQRLLDSKSIDAYAIKKNARGDSVMGVRIGKTDWSYLTTED
ncbi:hypothetical protein LB559_09460 [Mesorhizobium sp. BR1-1-3]|uniref:hypothetical protein n=1 Tax=Mesorhizobium sp. BR1-1-3 TaxID=2876651 RepID=UPI001CD13268|nr:hypothetical protein [Mesorhizobium sp. BR1-1-3]MBZ9888166.1 hypothetical protein [Mesorhizobium sp. BR1-1-3]